MITDLNIALFISLPILYGVNYLIYQKKKRIIIFQNKKMKDLQNKKMKDLQSILIMLSKEMTGQLLLVEFTKSDFILKMQKYQSNNLWGIKLLVDLENNCIDLESMEKLFKKINLKYSITPDNSELIIDTGHNINYLVEIAQLLIESLGMDSDLQFNYVMAKRSATFI